MLFMGIDPGKSGAVAIVDEEGTAVGWIGLHETPHDVAAFMVECAPNITFGVLERVGARIGNSASSMFKFGTSYGFCIGALTFANIRFEIHTPSQWQKKLSLLRPKLTNAEKKRVNKERAQQLFVSAHKIIHRNADAFLIAEYARRLHLGV